MSILWRDTFNGLIPQEKWKPGHDPEKIRLRLLPLGPDRIGETPVRAGLPKTHIKIALAFSKGLSERGQNFLIESRAYSG